MHGYTERLTRASLDTPQPSLFIHQPIELALVKPQPFARPAGQKLQRSQVLIRRTIFKSAH